MASVDWGRAAARMLRTAVGPVRARRARRGQGGRHRRRSTARRPDRHRRERRHRRRAGTGRRPPRGERWRAAMARRSAPHTRLRVAGGDRRDECLGHGRRGAVTDARDRRRALRRSPRRSVDGRSPLPHAPLRRRRRCRGPHVHCSRLQLAAAPPGPTIGSRGRGARGGSDPADGSGRVLADAVHRNGPRSAGTASPRASAA